MKIYSKNSCFICLYPTFESNQTLFSVLESELFSKVFVHVPLEAEYEISMIKSLDSRIIIMDQRFKTKRGFFIHAFLQNLRNLNFDTEYLCLLPANCSLLKLDRALCGVLLERNSLKINRRNIASILRPFGFIFFITYLLTFNRPLKCQHEGIMFDKRSVTIVNNSLAVKLYCFLANNFPCATRVIYPFAFEEYIFANVLPRDRDIYHCCEVSWSGSGDCNFKTSFFKLVTKR